MKIKQEIKLKIQNKTNKQKIKMKKMKNMKLKAVLLSLVAVLAIGLTSCSDETSGDQTQGKPGYLTINVKTLKPNQAKLSGTHATDFQKISTMDIFVFSSTDQVLIHKFTSPNSNTGSANLDIAVNQLAGNEYVVVVANYDGTLTDATTGMTGIATIGDLTSREINTVQDFTSAGSKGLHMTGKANIESLANGSYASSVNIAPVEAKITVNWNFSTELSSAFKVTGIYVVNAITKTTLPIIRDRVVTGHTWAGATNILPNNYINLSGTTNRNAATGLSPATNTSGLYDFNLYDALTASTILKDEDAAGLVSTANKYYYYLGENYSNNVTPSNGSAIAGITIPNSTTATPSHANTIVIIKVTPTGTTYGSADRYYTYEFDKNSNEINRYNVTTPNIALGGQIAPTSATEVGFSIRRKTDYKLTFGLNSIGATEPFKRIRTLSVTVTAETWDDGTTSANF